MLCSGRGIRGYANAFRLCIVRNDPGSCCGKRRGPGSRKATRPIAKSARGRRCRSYPAASQIREAELHTLVAGKRIVMLRTINVVTDGSRKAQRQLERFGRPTHRRLAYVFRDDGSVRLHCDMLDGAAGAGRPCHNIAGQQGARGPDEVGTWRIATDALCLNFSRLGEGAKSAALCTATATSSGFTTCAASRAPVSRARSRFDDA